MDKLRSLRTPKHFSGAVLRPITRPGMNFAHRSHSLAKLEPDRRADSDRVPRRSVEPHAKAGPGTCVFVQARRRSILSTSQVNEPAFIKIRQARPPCLSTNAH